MTAPTFGWPASGVTHTPSETASPNDRFSRRTRCTTSGSICLMCTRPMRSG